MQATQATIPSEALLKHWQGHRELTRRVIDAFPEDKLFSYSIGGMRTFADLALEMLDLAEDGIVGLANDKWTAMNDLKHISGIGKPQTKAELLQMWDNTTQNIEQYWPTITAERFNETVAIFGQYENTVFGALQYFIDNENHHRGQGYVYLRALGIEPPFFWQR